MVGELGKAPDFDEKKELSAEGARNPAPKIYTEAKSKSRDSSAARSQETVLRSPRKKPWEMVGCFFLPGFSPKKIEKAPGRQGGDLELFLGVPF